MKVGEPDLFVTGRRLNTQCFIMARGSLNSGNELLESQMIEIQLSGCWPGLFSLLRINGAGEIAQCVPLDC